MIRIQGVPIAAERLQKALRPACQARPRQGTGTAATSARDDFQTGIDMDPGTIIQGSSDTACCLQSRIG